MANKPPYKRSTAKPVDPNELVHADFRWFITHFPAEHLKAKKIKRTSFVAVGLTLAQFGRYEDGTRVRPSTKALHMMTGAHENTIKKVLDLLVALHVLEVVGLHQGENGGQPYREFRFRRSAAVKLVLAKRNATDWDELRPKPRDPERQPQPIRANPTAEVANPTAEDNRNTSNTSNSSVANAPSSLSSSGDESSQEEDPDDGWDEFARSIYELDSKSNGPSFEEHWQQLVAEAKR
ncbi:hypothetical protein [uncultured Microbacterium sp.]|uniref:hypothetical protein n=1 Tax=uncultured Microbacterium sp. TaxID=191216 RepID=UPI0025E3C7C3|nr:hypothetical protein [uncultured Microbacterium sp.]